MPEAKVDGRRAKGQRRRAELIEATLRVVARHGISQVTHRVVAREAGLATTASTYYFSSVDDMLCAALTHSVDMCMRQVQSATVAEDPVRVLAEYFASPDPGSLLAEYELFLQAARRSELREVTDRWREVMRQFAARFTSDPLRANVIAAGVDGILLHALVSPALDVDELERQFRALVE